MDANFVTAGHRRAFGMTLLADRHLRPGWVRTIHSAQGATSDHVLAHVESYRANIVDARAVYVAINCARHGAAIYTDSRASLTEALGIRDGNQVAAIDTRLYPHLNSSFCPVINTDPLAGAPDV